MTSSVFLKSQERIIALAVVMCLCLLVYMIAQRYLRARLEQARASIPNQLGKATRTPTMRWIFQLFEGIHVLIHKTCKKRGNHSQHESCSTPCISHFGSAVRKNLF